jgi:penicillin-insensitive murein endopeptidase
VVPSLWSPQISQLIKLAAEDSDVTRIFVNPAIKQQLCLDAGSDREWLRKVRPWFQHRAHMHVRLRCPAGSLECEDQAPPPPAMAAVRSCKAGLNHLNPDQPSCEEDAASAAAFLPGATG